MASPEQSTAMEISLDASALSHSESQNSLMEMGPTESHLLDVRGPELVYNIDEETRMGPEMTNDGITPPSNQTTAKEQGGRSTVAKPLPQEGKSSTPNTNNSMGAPFSGLSIIAAQYAESDNSSPRSLNSPAGAAATEEGGGGGGGGAATVVPEASGHSSDGFDTSSLQATPCEQASGSGQVEEDKVCSEKVGSGGDAPAVSSRPAPSIYEDKRGGRGTEANKEDDTEKEVQPSKVISDQVRTEETGSDKKEAAAGRDARESGLDKDTEKGGVGVEMDTFEKKDVDANVVSAEESGMKKGEAEVKPEILPESAEVGGEGAGEKVTKDVVNEEIKTDITAVVVSGDVKQEPAEGSAAPEGKKTDLTAQPEQAESSEPMEIDDTEEEQRPAQEKMVTKDTKVVSEKKKLVDLAGPVRHSSEPQQTPEAVSVVSSDRKLILDTDSVMSEDSKLDSKVAPDADSDMCEDSTQPPDVDSVMIGAGSKLVSNTDSVLSEDSKLVPNMDFGLSEDSKLNLDSVLSSGPEESEENSFAMKGPSVVVPFGENANSSIPFMGMEAESSNISFVDESSQSNSMFEKPSRPKRPRRSSISDIQDSKHEHDGLLPFLAERVFEYQWPQDGGEWYLLQEQISEYLGVLSFKRKYPDLSRRTCDKLEKEFLREKGVVTETQSDLGLTAIRSEEVYDLMMKDYPDKYHEYATLLHEKEKQKISDKHKEYEAAAQPKLEKSKMADYTKKAAKSAAEYNRHLLRERKEERLAFFDLQTFMVQYPERRYKKLPPEVTKPSAYPVALIPGQFQDHYCSYTSDELRYFPLNTALYDPPKKMSNTLAKPASSGDSSDSSSDDKSGSSSDSTGSSDSETPAAAAGAASTPGGKTTGTDANHPITVTSTPAEAAVTPGKKSGKKGVVTKTPAKTPKRPLGRPLKGKRKLDTSEERKEGSTSGAAPFGVGAVSVGVSVATLPASLAPKKEKTDEEEDKDKCTICSNAVLFLKYKRVETKMIKCAECGKLAHPTCLELTPKMVQVVSTYPWQCMDCKTCVECMDPFDEDKMLFCDQCDRGYHTFCVGLRCLPPSGRRWVCRSCKGVAEVTKSRRGRPLKPQ
ncbi:hypothetical protein ACOMHN_002883 [Nucella lapillus]